MTNLYFGIEFSNKDLIYSPAESEESTITSCVHYQKYKNLNDPLYNKIPMKYCPECGIMFHCHINKITKKKELLPEIKAIIEKFNNFKLYESFWENIDPRYIFSSKIYSVYLLVKKDIKKMSLDNIRTITNEIDEIIKLLPKPSIINNYGICEISTRSYLLK